MTEYIIIKLDNKYCLVQRLGLDNSKNIGKLNVSMLKTLATFDCEEDMLDFLGIMDILYKDSLKESEE